MRASDHRSKDRHILIEGRNCWRKVRAERVAFLVDGEAYFSAVAEALRRARSSVLIVGWDLDPGIVLERDGVSGVRLGDLLRHQVERRAHLTAHVLEWDFGLVYATHEPVLPIFSRRWPSHRRIQHRTDDRHPAGASHHQKLVVIDDKVAFVGGFDLTRGRWDTSDHLPRDTRRLDPSGDTYGPMHDVQVVVDGDAARLLGRVARTRWERATGRTLRPSRNEDADPWPPALKPDAVDMDVAVARTEPAYHGLPDVREVERLYLDSIAAARRWIYVESQYLTSAAVADAFASRLQEHEGPEIVVVLTRDSSGWLEQSTMDVLRTRLLDRLRKADRSGRFRVYYPTVPHEGGRTTVYVHSKVMVVDETLLRVGSSNLSNRSMGTDTECDIALEVAEVPEEETIAAALRNRLLGEHLGVTPRAIASTLRSTGSLIETVKRLSGEGRTLVPLQREAPGWLLETVPDSELVDPERPLRLDRWIARTIPEALRRRVRWQLVVAAVGLAVGSSVVGVWLMTPFGHADISRLLAELEVGTGAGTITAMASGFVLATIVFVPLTFLTFLAVAALGFWPGFALAVGGGLLGALAGYGLGRRLKRDTVRRLARWRVNQISARLVPTGLLGIVLLRLLPASPFGMVNLVAGAVRVRLGEFALGTLVGLTPLLLAVTLFTDRLFAVLRRPAFDTFSTFAGVIVGAVAGGLALQHWLGALRHRKGLFENGDREVPRSKRPDEGSDRKQQ